MTALWRNRSSGDVIHRADCRYAKPNGGTWIWAERNPDEDWEKTAPWLRACKVCKPPSPAGRQ